MPEADAPSSAEALYRALVVGRARTPVFAGAVEGADGAGEGANPLCGDRVAVSLRRDAEGRVAEIRHESDGCAICVAAADLMAETVSGLDAVAIGALRSGFEAMLRDGAAATSAPQRDRLGLLNAFADLHEYKSRRKCATLPWSALSAALAPDGKE
ncbi:SUF system NifU family Fe-S cluster assembly protein [Acetobacteraceae bacterium KSS8]|uniref:SUF system NifU family Fe-S cluster assembly protein n=1 Tax=Endosaccharibacter trunci TaxID=2812733 RepID=A0ABT1W495_9PROT|nr:SUF system NifU family Fe-S cluster assembly protein [Acetobacteraceae bacterium KSS8]